MVAKAKTNKAVADLKQAKWLLKAKIDPVLSSNEHN